MRMAMDNKDSRKRRVDSKKACRANANSTFGEDKENAGATNNIIQRVCDEDRPIELKKRGNLHSLYLEEKASPFSAEVPAAEERELERRRERDLERAWMQTADEEMVDVLDNFRAGQVADVRFSKLKYTIFGKGISPRHGGKYEDCMKKSPLKEGSYKLCYTGTQGGAEPLKCVHSEMKTASKEEYPEEAEPRVKTVHDYSWPMNRDHHMAKSKSFSSRVTLAQKHLEQNTLEVRIQEYLERDSLRATSLERIPSKSTRYGKGEYQKFLLNSSSCSRLKEGIVDDHQVCGSQMQLRIRRSGSQNTNAATGKTPARETLTLPITPRSMQRRKTFDTRGGIEEAIEISRQRSVAQRARLDETLKCILKDHQNENCSDGGISSWMEKLWRTFFSFTCCSYPIACGKSTPRARRKFNHIRAADDKRNGSSVIRIQDLASKKGL